MEWQKDSAAGTQNVQAGTCEAVVMQTTGGMWTAVVSRSGVEIAHDSFATLQDAQAWCEMHLTQYQAEKLCGS